MGNESSSAKRKQQQQDDGGTTAKKGNGTRPLSANLEDSGAGKAGKSSSFRRRTKSDATSSSKPPANHQQAPPTQAPPPARDEEVNVSIKIYRSMNNLDDSAKKAPIESLHDKVPDYKIHRRSNVDISEMQPGSSQSLPRSLSRRNRPRSTLSVSHDGTVVVETGSPADYPELRNSRNRSSASSEPGTPRARLSTLPKKVTLLMSDFPSTSETRRKLKLFETNFAQALVARFERLDHVRRLSVLLLAVRFDKAGNELLSLWHYASRTDLEADIFASTMDTDRFYPLQPDAILAQAVQLKRFTLDADEFSNDGDPESNRLWLSLAHDVAVSIATEAAAEVARVYEYQVAMLGEDASIALAAAHAAECALTYVLDKGFPLDRNSAVQGVVYGRTEYHAATPTMFSVVLGNSELKWELHDLFQKPGLRKDMALVSASFSSGGFRFFASKQSDGQLYGYRGQIVDWDMGRGTYKLNPADEEQFTIDETDDSEDGTGADKTSDNVHRLYRPFRRLVGYELMTQYCSDALLSQREGSISLRRYLLGPHDAAADRDDVQPIYRPLAKDKKNPLTFHKTRLDGADLCRARFPKTDWQQVTSARGASLLHCDLGPSPLSTADWERLEAADVSYSKVCVSETPTLKKLKAVYTLFDVTTDPGTTTTSVLITNDRGVLKTAAEAIEDKKMQVDEARQQAAAAAANESVIRASVVTGASTAPGKAHKRATVTGDGLLASSTAASSNGGTAERSKKRSTLPPTTNDKSVTSGETPVRKTSKSKGAAVQSQTLPRSSTSSTPQDTRLGSASSATSRESAASGSSPQAAGQKTSKQTSPSMASRTSTKPDSPVTPRSPNERGSANRSSFGQVVTTFMSTPLDDAKYGSLRSSWQQSPEKASPIPSSAPAHTSHHDTSIDDGDASLRRESAVNGGHAAVAETAIELLKPLLPDLTSPLIGRSTDIQTLCRALIKTSQRLVVLIGQAGVGKSTIGQTAARLLQQKPANHTPLYIDVRGALTTDGVFRRMMLALALRFQIFEVPLLVTWLACRQQNLLILLDNVEVSPDNDSLLCALIDDLLAGVPKLKILVTCNRQFYDGPLACKLQVVDVMSDADICTLIQKLLATQSVAQNCLDKDVTELSLKPAVILSETIVNDIIHLCQGNPFLCKIIINSLHLSDVQYRLLSKLSDEALENASVRKSSNESGTSNTDKQSANGINSQENVLRTLQLTIASLPPLHQRLLDMTSKFAASFSASEIQFMLTSSEADEVSAVEAALTELHKARYLTASHTRRGARYRLPALVRLALSSDRSTHLSFKFVTLFVGKLTYLKDSFFSRDSLNAFIDFNEDVDSINDFLLDVALRDSNVVYDALRHVASLVYVVLFTTLLPEDTYVHLYTRLASVAERCSDIIVQAAALSCLAWHQLVNQQYSDARRNLQIALDAQLRAQRLSIPVSNSSISAFCQLCQARLLWIEQQEKAIELAREAVDALRTSLGYGDITTLIASEICDMMLIDRSSFVNQSVTGEMAEYPLEAALGVHPLLLRSYGSRRLLWDKFGLFLRARDMAAKAVDIARHFYADHPLTADALVLLASSDVKLGAISQALDSAVVALAIRRQTLGVHEKTASAYVMVARILRRACRYDDAVVSAERALGMYEVLSDTDNTDRETLVSDVRTLIKQCVAKQRYVPPSTTPVLHEGVPVIASEVTPACLQFQQTAVPTKSGAVKPVPKPKPKLISAQRDLTSSERDVQRADVSTTGVYTATTFSKVVVIRDISTTAV